MKEELGLAYKRLGVVSLNFNRFDSLLQRQYAGAQYIELMVSGKRILNIDESVLRSTDHRKRGWIMSGKKNYAGLA